MEIQEIREWLDWHVANIKECQAHMNFNQGIRTCSPDDYIHVYAGIEIIADMLGAKLETEKLRIVSWNKEYTQYSFMYGDTKVIQLGGINDAK